MSIIRSAAAKVLVTATLLGALLTGCGDDSIRVSAGPVVERTTVDGVETVRNVSGSEWGELTLETIAEIGSDESDEYLLAQPFGLWVTDDTVYVADWEMGLRSYTRDGQYLRKYGRSGQGPGEYEQVTGVTELSDGRVVAGAIPKMIFYDHSGALLEEWRLPLGEGGYMVMGGQQLVTTDGEMLWRVARFPEEGAMPSIRDTGYLQLGPEGWEGDYLHVPLPDFEPESVSYPCPTGECSRAIPYSPRATAAMMADRTVVSGVSDRYRFTLTRSDGSVLVVERFDDPAPVTARERAVSAAQAQAGIRRRSPGYQFDAGLIPDHKAAYMTFLSPRDGRIFVAREAETLWNEFDCGPESDWTPASENTNCLSPQYDIDIFAADGRYLGHFRRPPDALVTTAHIDGEELWAYGEGLDGNPVVRGYRMVKADGSVAR